MVLGSCKSQYKIDGDLTKYTNGAMDYLIGYLRPLAQAWFKEEDPKKGVELTELYFEKIKRILQKNPGSFTQDIVTILAQKM